jgi:CBS domain-containing protein
MSTIRHILQHKGCEVWTTSPDTIVFDALILMAEKNIGALLVVDQDNLVGILSERDYARKVVLKGKASRDLRVSEIMTDKVVYIRPEQTPEESLALMTDKKVRHLPVLEEHQLVGLISIGDVVKAIISDREFTIDQLENFITGVGCSGLARKNKTFVAGSSS